MIKRIAPAISFFLLFFAFSAEGQIVKKAQVGFRFLENPVSAEVVGRGTIGVTTTLNSSSIFWNPSQLGWITTTADLGVSHIAKIGFLREESPHEAIGILI